MDRPPATATVSGHSSTLHVRDGPAQRRPRSCHQPSAVLMAGTSGVDHVAGAAQPERCPRGGQRCAGADRLQATGASAPARRAVGLDDDVTGVAQAAEGRRDELAVDHCPGVGARAEHGAEEPGRAPPGTVMSFAERGGSRVRHQRHRVGAGPLGQEDAESGAGQGRQGGAGTERAVIHDEGRDGDHDDPDGRRARRGGDGGRDGCYQLVAIHRRPDGGTGRLGEGRP